MLQYLVRIADVAGVDLSTEVWRKLKTMNGTAPAEVRGIADKR